jgi:hypothetical protein
MDEISVARFSIASSASPATCSKSVAAVQLWRSHMQLTDKKISSSNTMIFRMANKGWMKK